LLLGHKGQSSNYPCVWCKKSKESLHQLPVPQDRLRTDNNILLCAQRMQRWQTKEQLQRQNGALTRAQKDEKEDENKRCKSIQNLPMRSIPLRDFSPAPMHVFMGIVNNILKYEWEPAFGKETVRQILHGRGIYFERHSAHSLAGNGVKKLLNCFDAILFDFHNMLHSGLTLLCHHYYSSFFENLREMYRLCMRVEDLSPEQISIFSSLCQNYVSQRQLCMQLMHGNPHHRRFTPKEHALLAHFEQFMLDHNSLGRYSEESHESLHHDFNVIAEKAKSEHNYAAKLPGIVRYVNEMHLHKLKPNQMFENSKSSISVTSRATKMILYQ